VAGFGQARLARSGDPPGQAPGVDLLLERAASVPALHHDDTTRGTTMTETLTGATAATADSDAASAGSTAPGTANPHLLAADPTATSFPVGASPEEEAAARIGAFAERIVGLMNPATDLFTIELGRRFGLYRALHERGPLTAGALARDAGVAPRYAREWLEQQTAAGYLAVDDVEAAAADRRYSIPEHHVPVLVDETHPAHVAPVAGMLAGVALAFPALVADFRQGRGVAFHEYGAELRQGLGGLNRPTFTYEMRDWIEHLPSRAEQLDEGGTVLDAGCGTGWSTIAIATAFPHARVVGIDLDEASVEEAREHAIEAGVADRVSFVLGDAADAEALRRAGRLAGGATDDADAEAAASGFDLITVFEALHDLARPVDALAVFRAALAPGGAMLVADERVGDAFTAEADPVERMLYAMSVLHCVPATTAEDGDVVNGTVLRAPTLRAWAEDAGFGRVDVLDIENPFWRFYRIG
jgi:SAM-dependent methyltransferase